MPANPPLTNFLIFTFPQDGVLLQSRIKIDPASRSPHATNILICQRFSLLGALEHDVRVLDADDLSEADRSTIEGLVASSGFFDLPEDLGTAEREHRVTTDSTADPKYAEVLQPIINSVDERGTRGVDPKEFVELIPWAPVGTGFQFHGAPSLRSPTENCFGPMCPLMAAQRPLRPLPTSIWLGISLPNRGSRLPALDVTHGAMFY